MPAEPGIDADSRPASGLDESEPRIVRTREGRVAWHEAGRSADGVPLVLVHGFSGHRDDWIGVLPALARRRRVIAPDLRGHGDSEPGPGELGFSLDQLARDLTAFLDALEIDRIDLLGHSVGGFVALRFALARPERVRSLVFVCTAPETPSGMDRDGWRRGAEIAEARGMHGMQALAERAIRADPFPSLDHWGDPERYYAHHRRRYRAMSAASYRAIGEAFFTSESLVARLGEIDVPTLVLVGEHDVDWLPGADAFEAGLRDVRRVTLTDAEHHPHQENREAFLAEVAAHLDAVSRTIQPGGKS